MTKSRYNPIKTNLRAMSDSRYFYLHKTTLRKVAKCSWSISGLRRATSGPNVEHRFWTWSLTPWLDEAYGMFWEVGKSALHKGAKWVITVSETVGPCSASERVHRVYSTAPWKLNLGGMLTNMTQDEALNTYAWFALVFAVPWYIIKRNTQNQTNQTNPKTCAPCCLWSQNEDVGVGSRILIQSSWDEPSPTVNWKQTHSSAAETWGLSALLHCYSRPTQVA